MDSADLEQNTDEWRDARAGCATASRIHAVMAKPKKGTKEAATRANYKAQIVAEILSGKATEEEYESWYMKRGKALEPQARIEYELQSREKVSTCGFIKHPSIPRAGASPDALVGNDGIAQFKCGASATHLAWLLEGIVPLEHRPQMYFEMACTGRKWSDFVSYDPALSGHELFIKRLERDEAEIEKIEEEVRKFLAEVNGVLIQLGHADKVIA